MHHCNASASLCVARLPAGHEHPILLQRFCLVLRSSPPAAAMPTPTTNSITRRGLGNQVRGLPLFQAIPTPYPYEKPDPKHQLVENSPRCREPEAHILQGAYDPARGRWYEVTSERFREICGIWAVCIGPTRIILTTRLSQYNDFCMTHCSCAHWVDHHVYSSSSDDGSCGD